MTRIEDSFSARQGYGPPDAEITVREDAPEAVRSAVVMLAYDVGLSPSELRDELCEVLLKRPDPNNWSETNIRREVDHLVDEAQWFKVYDLAERIYARAYPFDPARAEAFARRLNAMFRELGVGWQMDNGCIVIRGTEAFTLALRDVSEAIRQSGRFTAAAEIHEAVRDISRRPEADVTGAIQHSMAALECVSREVTGEKKRLGQLVSELGLPKPMDEAILKLWGFTSEQGRHIMEGREPKFEEAELVVTVAAAISLYLLKADARSKRGS